MLRHASLAVLAAALLVAPAAQAGPPVFGVPATLATEGTDPSVAIGLGGDAVVAWAGRRSGVFVARRSALGGAFVAPERISDEEARAVRVTRNPAGALAVVWVGGTDPSQPAELRAAVAPGGRRFGPPETVPLPAGARGPAHAGDTGRPAAVLGADGSLTVATSDMEQRMLAAVRAPGASFAPAQVLAERAPRRWRPTRAAMSSPPGRPTAAGEGLRSPPRASTSPSGRPPVSGPRRTRPHRAGASSASP